MRDLQCMRDLRFALVSIQTPSATATSGANVPDRNAVAPVRARRRPGAQGELEKGEELVAVGEPGDVGDLYQQPGGAGGADALQVVQAGAGGFDELLELLVRGFARA